MNESSTEYPAGRHRVAIVGGGITGLAAAHRLINCSPSVQVTVFEASLRLGGIIRTESAEGFLMELGPDSFITNKPVALQICEELGFSDRLIPTDARFRRSLVLRRGKPCPVPDGFMLMAPSKVWSILTTPVLSLKGRLRLLAEALIPRKKVPGDESLASFVRRRFGTEALERLVQPLVGGIYTSDPEKLSLLATMPRFSDMEQQFGSVIRGTLAGAGDPASDGKVTSGSGARYGLFVTAAAGLSDLIRSLESSLKASGRVNFQLGVRIQQIRQLPINAGILVSPENGTTAPFDAVVMTLPTHAVSRLLPDDEYRDLCVLLNQIEYASSAIVVSGHRLSDFQHPMDAFGLVVPAIERRKILAVSMSSRKFLNRAPEGQLLLRTFVGGAMQPELLLLDDEQLITIVNDELRQIFGMSDEPMFSEVMRYHHAMPQYHVGHLQRVQAIESALRPFPRLKLAGSAYHGVGIPDSIASGRTAADQLLATLSLPGV